MKRLMIIYIVLIVSITVGACVMIACAQPQHSAMKKNAYWPYSVETSIKDR